MSTPTILTVDNYDLEEFCSIAGAYGDGRCNYVVTPNVDHVIRYCEDAQFQALYADAGFVLLDSQFLAHLIRILHRLRLSVCPGSDLTRLIFSRVIKPDDVTVLVGGTPHQAEELRRRFGLRALHHIDPPMGFIRDQEAVKRCLRQIEALSPFRFCFLAIGSPQQEMIAHSVKQGGVARGLLFCIGASINFITGAERRAPGWMQRLGIEWLFRLLQNPRRLARRYLVRGPRIFLLLTRIRWRPRRATVVPDTRIGAYSSSGSSAIAPLVRK